ncbi:hypothetical protein HGRIS_002729 [Hohenbuehelia grisea]|uniref:Uncharacterized protein n=1 Tax=Hohenbuehelia grisea TaxID=104357 RepID=A0ABR3JMJ7_9AGAR
MASSSTFFFHPSEALVDGSSNSSYQTYVLNLNHEAPSEETPSSPKAPRDPHHLPTFDTQSIIQPTEPILYLPPLLSSLPPQHASVATPRTAYPPLATVTRLPDIDPVSLSLHKALHSFKPYDANYASKPYAEAFNWSELVLEEDEERDWYCVVFRSKRRPGSENAPLYEADRLAHEEAVQNGGLILYWYGIPNPETGMNLATCIWQSRKHAIAANSRPHHIAAMKLAAASFSTYELERYRLRKVRGESHVAIEPYIGGDVGW